MNGTIANTEEYLAGLPEWQQANLVLFRQLIYQVSPAITEEIKWGVPVFFHDKKMAFSMGSFKSHTKYNFIQNGALLQDSKNLFNNGLESKKSRGIDLEVGQEIDENDLCDLIKQAIDKL